MKFRVGDRIEMIDTDPAWNRMRQPDGRVTGVVIRDNPGDDSDYYVELHIDGFDYELDRYPNNHHNVAPQFLRHDSVPVTDGEMDAVIASITEAARRLP